jgi:mannose-6-phosphate isomerase-like protein (cupin superfamily)
MGETKRFFSNPMTGHQVTYLQTAEETGGELLQLEYVVTRPERPLVAIPLHFHHLSEERFEVTAGSLGVMIGRKKEERLLGPGEQVLIPPDTVHAFWNAGQDELSFITDIRPAGQLALYWETVFGLAAEGKLNENGAPGLWQVAVMVPMIDTYAPGLPVGFQKFLFGNILGWIGRRLGYKARYEEIGENGG